MWAGSPWADRPWADGPAVSGGLPAISGDFAANEGGADAAAFVGALLVSGSLAAIEAGSDTASFRETAGSASSIRFDISSGRLVKILSPAVCITF